MSDPNDIPVLTDLIESGPEITIADLGLDDDPVLGTNDMSFDIDDVAPISHAANANAPFEISPALEQTVRRILDEHMELAWQEIRLAIQQHLDRS
jgi:hypothetical protein